MRWLPLSVGALALVAGLALAKDAGLILQVIDGDSYVVLLDGVSKRVRLANADTPETGERARCAEELEVGNRATQWVRDQVGKRRVEVRPTGKIDKYGRVIAYVTLDGQDLGELLVTNGLGRAYRGERRMTWCPER